MTRLWWVSLATEMRQTTGARRATWLGGAGSTISLWMWRRRRRLLLISGKCTLSMLLWPSTVRLWRERAAPSFWVCTSEDLSWTNNTAALAKKAQQRLYFLRKLRRARAPTPIMCTFYRGTIESILTSCITVWYGACNASCRKSLQRIVRAAEKIVGVSLPSLQDIYSTRLTRKALSIAGDPTHPTHSFFSLLPSGRRLRSLQARTSRLKDSFIHQAVRKLNSLPSLRPLPSFTPRNTELCHYDPPPPMSTPPGPPPPYNCDPHQSLCAALELSLPHPALSVIYLFWQSDKRLFFFLHYSHLHSCVLFNWFALYLPCALCHFTLSISCFFCFFLQCPHLYICIVCMYIWLNWIYLYLNVYCQCLMLTVCTKGLRVMQFQFSVCMYMWKNWQ